MSEDNWYDQPIDDDWSDVSNTTGYDSDGNWTGQGSNGQSLFQNNYNNAGIPNMEDDPMNYAWGKESLAGYDNNGNWTNDQNVRSGSPSIFGRGMGTQSMTQQTSQAGTQDFLSRLFSNPAVLSKGIGALFEGSQNKKMGRSMNQIAQNPALDPFGSQRPFYQQQLQQAVTNPYDSPMVRSQVDNMQRMQDIKDAAAGRRSNSLSSAPGVLAAQAGIAQKYMDSLQRPAGAFNGPSGDTIAKLLQGGAKYSTDGYTSPIFNAVQNGIRNQQFDDSRQQELEQLARLFSRG